MYSQLRRFIGLHVGWDQLWQYALLKTKRKKIFSLHFVWSTTLPWNSTVLLDAESQKICVRPISAMANFCFYVLKSVVTFIVLPCLFWIDGNNKAWDENYTIAFIKDFIPVDTLAMLPLMTSKWQSMTYVLSVIHENLSIIYQIQTIWRVTKGSWWHDEQQTSWTKIAERSDWFQRVQNRVLGKLEMLLFHWWKHHVEPAATGHPLFPSVR
jgi:hypothetical protein